ncbi:MAG: papain-like cysteine protease family protein [Oscillospiraceae bacterium]
MKKKIISILICICLTITYSPSFNIITNATVQYDGVNVNVVKQAKSQWCWAACAEMAGKNVYPSSKRTQYTVVKYIKGSSSNSYPNVTGTIANSATGSQYVAYNRKTFKSTASKWSFSKIVSSMRKGYAVEAGAGYYSNGKRNGGHVVVISGTQFVDNSSGTFYYIDYIDPWDGSFHHCTYSSFCNGTYNSRKYDQTIYVS